MSRDRRRLGAEEEALWTAVKRTVTPLKPQSPEPPPKPPAAAAVPPAPADIAASTPPKPTAPAGKPLLPPMHTLGRRERLKVSRGTLAIEARLDLHGLRQDEARARLEGFLHRAQANGYKLVLVITGKGRPGGGFEALHEPERGVLKRVVPMWLSMPDFRSLVVGYEDAHLANGGTGALYVRIRRRK